MPGPYPHWSSPHYDRRGATVPLREADHSGSRIYDTPLYCHRGLKLFPLGRFMLLFTLEPHRYSWSQTWLCIVDPSVIIRQIIYGYIPMCRYCSGHLKWFLWHIWVIGFLVTLPPYYCWLYYRYAGLGLYLLPYCCWLSVPACWDHLIYISVLFSLYQHVLFLLFQLFIYTVPLFPWYRRLTACSWFVLNRLVTWCSQHSSFRHRTSGFVSLLPFLAAWLGIGFADWIVFFFLCTYSCGL